MKKLIEVIFVVLVVGAVIFYSINILHALGKIKYSNLKDFKNCNIYDTSWERSLHNEQYTKFYATCSGEFKIGKIPGHSTSFGIMDMISEL